MRVVFMGTPDIAATCLQRLVQTEHEIVGVYTKPDMPKNRGMKLEMSDVKKLALQAELPIYQPTTFKDDAVYEELKALQPDVIAVVAYGKILPQRILDIARLGCVNIHASVLPELRGSGPVQWAILNGMEETGVTAMFMSAQLDAGDIIEIRKTPIDPYENAQSLLDRLALIGSELLCDTLTAIENGTASRTPQEHDKATYAPMLSKELCPIDWTKSGRQIIDHVRGLDPWPVATTTLNEKRFKIYAVRPVEGKTDRAPGTLLALTKQGLQIACGDGEILMITQLQADGGKRMAAVDYFRGHPIEL
ncbi:MAG: methionyl-tRNA formyltransferase [Ruminococcaceae bacterium]|nr:methionyl-tRNA formyltransferase [Oscillospiraceae bacterium]